MKFFFLEIWKNFFIKTFPLRGLLDKKEFTVFMWVRAKEIISVIKNTRSLKGPRQIFDKVLDSNHFDQYLKYSVCEKADEIL